MEENMSEIEATPGIEVISQQSELIDERSVVLNSSKSLEPNFQPPTTVVSHNNGEIHMGSGIPNPAGSSLATLDHTQHYYENLHHQTPIMVYEVPAGSNIVPFESLVTMPGLSKTLAAADKAADVGILQASINNQVYHHHHHQHQQQQQQHQEQQQQQQQQQELPQPMYVLHQSPHHKKQNSDLNQSLMHDHGNMVVRQHIPDNPVPSNIALENKEHDDFHKVSNQNNTLEMPLVSEFNLISNSGYENAITTVTNMPHLSMSAVYHTSSETDSEVALTLASLGNPKNESLHHFNHSSLNESSDVIRAASIISGVSENQHFDSIEMQVSDDENGEIKKEKKDQTPSLILRSRKGRNISDNLQNSERSNSEEPKKSSKKRRNKKEPKYQRPNKPIKEELLYQDVLQAHTREFSTGSAAPIQNESRQENLLGQLLKASEHCEPATLIPSGVVDDVIPAVGYRIVDMTALSEMIRMMHRCSTSGNISGGIVIQEQASLREGAVSQLSIICTGCQEGAVCATSIHCSGVSLGSTNEPWDINVRVEQLSKEFNIKEDQVQRMLEILGIFYRPCTVRPQVVESESIVKDPDTNINTNKKKKKKKSDLNNSSKPKNFICNVCKEAFAGENHLKQHMHSHDLSLHTCPYCHAYFKKPFNLRQHIKKHENYKFECTECSRSFTDRSTLKSHIKVHHEKRLDIQCERCPKRFYHRAHLKEHMRTHTGEKPYMCELCGKKFAWHDSVKKHMQTHSAESKYKCRLCGKWYRWLQGVRKHLQQAHKLKKSDIEAQVMSAAATHTTSTAGPLTQFTHARQHQEQHQDTQIHQQQQQDQQHHEQQQHQHQQLSLHQSHHAIEAPQQQQQQAGGESCDPCQEYHPLEGSQIAEGVCVPTSADNCAAQTLALFQVPDSNHQDMFNYHQPIN